MTAARESANHLPLGKIGEIQGGLQVTSKRKNLPEEAPYLRVANVFRGRLDLSEIKTMRVTAEEKRRAQLQPGDLLFVEGHGNPAEVGRVAVWDGSIDCCLHQNHLIRVRVDPGRAEPRYVARYFNSMDGRRQFQRFGKTTSGLNTISASNVRAARLPLPALGEQLRIADILDKADAIRRKRQEAIALTESLLRSTFLEMFADPVTNPKGWPTRPLGELAEFVGGGTPSRARPEFFTGDTCWATSKDMKGEELEDTQEHITEAAIQSSATKLVPPGVILVVVKSKVLMHRLPVVVSKVPTSFGQDLKAIVTGRDVNATYLARHMRVGQSSLLFKARGVNTEGLTLDHLREYEVMMPPASAIAEYTALEARIRNGLHCQARALDAAHQLFDSLVQRAFRGTVDDEVRNR